MPLIPSRVAHTVYCADDSEIFKMNSCPVSCVYVFGCLKLNFAFSLCSFPIVFVSITSGHFRFSFHVLSGFMF